jgi:predicted enzyme related to lactoylglutathione lyase
MADYIVLTLDCTDTARQRDFWCTALGYEVVGGMGPYIALGDPTGALPKMLLQQVPEPKTAKTRLHIDLHVADPEGECTRLVAAGATRVQRMDEFGLWWIVMHDPEGNEFCLVPS